MSIRWNLMVPQLMTKRTLRGWKKLISWEKNSPTHWVFSIPGTFSSAIRIYWDLSKIVIQKITLHQSALYFVMKRRQSGQRRHNNNLVKVLVVKWRDAKKRMTVSSESASGINLKEGIITMITVITLERVFKRGKIYGCATLSTRNVDGIIPTP